MRALLINIIFALIFIVSSTPETGAVTGVGSSGDTRCGAMRPVWALSTNLAGDIALIPNITVEATLGDRWSAAASWAGAWWGGRSKVWRIYGGDVEGSYWFGPRQDKPYRPLTGHHAGVFAGAVTYDFKTGRYGYQSPGATWFAGLSYGYALSLGKSLRLDMSVGVGYLTGRRDKYEDECGRPVYADRRRIRYFGPVKAEIALVWVIGHSRKTSD